MNIQREKKLDFVSGFLKPEMRETREALLFNCLSPEMTEIAGVEDTNNVSCNEYDIMVILLVMVKPATS